MSPEYMLVGIATLLACLACCVAFLLALHAIEIEPGRLVMRNLELRWKLCLLGLVGFMGLMVLPAWYSLALSWLVLAWAAILLGGRRNDRRAALVAQSRAEHEQLS